jgi:WD40 repeat protein
MRVRKAGPPSGAGRRKRRLLQAEKLTRAPLRPRVCIAFCCVAPKPSISELVVHLTETPRSPWPTCEPSRVEEQDGTVVQSAEALTQARQASRQEKPELPGYQIQRRLGDGSFGEVWAAVQNSTGQQVAIKFFFDRNRSDLGYIRRELERLREVSNHPAVVGLIDADLEHATPYFVMPLLSRSLGCEGGPPEVALAVKWLRHLANGLQHAHEKGLLHCDLKPSNLMLDEAGTVRLVDFGQSRQQGDGVVAWGTLGYMAPEQAQLGSEAVHSSPNVRWDVYGLGATFYRLLTGRYPYWPEEELRSLSAKDLNKRLLMYRESILTTPLTPVRTLNPKVDADLAAILEACVRPDPQLRIPSMTALLEDLGRRDRGEMLLCRQPWPLSYRLRTLARRPAVVVGLVSTLLLCGGAAYSYAQLSAAYAHQSRTLTDLTMQRAARAQKESKFEEAALWWCEALQRAPGDPVLRARLGSPAYAVEDIRQDYSESYVALPGRSELLLVGGKAGPQLWKAGQTESLKLPLAANYLRSRADGNLLAFRAGKEILIYDMARREVTRRVAVGGFTADAAWNAAGDLVVADGSTVSVWHGGQARPLRQLPGRVEHVDLSPDGLWARVEGPSHSRLVRLSDGAVRDLATDQQGGKQWFSPDSRWMVEEPAEQPVLISLRGEPDWKPAHHGALGCFAGSDSIAVLHGSQVSVEKWGEPETALTLQHESPIYAARAYGHHLLTLSQDQLYLWDLQSGRRLTSKPLSVKPEEAEFGVSGDAQRFFGCALDFKWIWRLDAPAPAWSKLESVEFTQLAWNDDGKWFVAANAEQWHVLDKDGNILNAGRWPERALSWALGPRGQLAAEFPTGIKLVSRIWHKPWEDVLAQYPSGQFEGFGRRVAFSADGNYLAACTPGKLKVWSLEDGERALRAEFPLEQEVLALAVAPSGHVATLTESDFFVWSSHDQSLVSRVAVQVTGPPHEVEFLESRVFGRAGNALWTQIVGQPDFASRRTLDLSIAADASTALTPARVLVAATTGVQQLRLPGLELLDVPLPFDVEPTLLQSAPGGDVWLRSDVHDTVLWDKDGVAPLLPSFGSPGVRSALFGADGRSLILAGESGGLFAWNLPHAQGDPDQILRRWQAATGYRLHGMRSVQPLTRQEWLDRRVPSMAR